MMEVFRKSPEAGTRHFLYGGKAGVAEKLKRILEERFPGIEISGFFCPPFRPLEPAEKKEVVKLINSSRPDIVWCGLGCPKQERWMAEFRPLLDASVLIGVGAGFDFLSGERRRAPAWVKKPGFEWLFRLLDDPVHLWKRYVRVVPLFLLYLAAEKTGLRKSS